MADGNQKSYASNGLSKTELWDAFDAYFPIIVQEITASENVKHKIEWSFNRIKDILEYNVPHGKRTRGLTVVSSFYSIKKGNVTPEEKDIAMSLGWAVEILQAAFLVADDLMDNSKTRRGRLCWYKKEGVNLQAVNDCMILESCVFVLLRNKCRNLPCYTELYELFHKVLLNTEMGQSLDMSTSELPEVDFSLFTEERYAAIIEYKTAYYSFYLPVAIALYLAGIIVEDCHKKVCDILTQMGSLFQVQDDYLDCFGDSGVTGKIGTDIEDNKCSWLIIKALALASPEQVKILEANYGKKNDRQCVKTVKEVFKDLNLPEVYETYERVTYEEISKAISSFDDPRIPKEVFTSLLNKIYQRKK